MGFQCALCEHWCEDGTRTTYRKEGRVYVKFKCFDCKHVTTLVNAPEQEE